MKTFTTTLRRALGATLLLAAATAASAQGFPSKLITMVVPDPAGGPSDFITRQIQPDPAKRLGQTIVVVNV